MCTCGHKAKLGHCENQIRPLGVETAPASTVDGKGQVLPPGITVDSRALRGVHPSGSAGGPDCPAPCPAPDSPQIPDLPAGFLGVIQGRYWPPASAGKRERSPSGSPRAKGGQLPRGAQILRQISIGEFLSI